MISRRPAVRMSADGGFSGHGAQEGAPPPFLGGMPDQAEGPGGSAAVATASRAQGDCGLLANDCLSTVNEQPGTGGDAGLVALTHETDAKVQEGAAKLQEEALASRYDGMATIASHCQSSSQGGRRECDKG